jgi:hypothetical protein
MDSMELREPGDVTWYLRHYLDRDGFRILLKETKSLGLEVCAYGAGGKRFQRFVSLPIESEKLDEFAADALKEFSS